MPIPAPFPGQRFKRGHEPVLIQSRSRLFWLCLGLFWLLLVSQMIWGHHGLLAWRSAERAVAERSAAIRAATARLEQLRKRNEAMQNSPEAQEEVARELYGYTTPGAIVFEFDDAKEWSIEVR